MVSYKITPVLPFYCGSMVNNVVKYFHVLALAGMKIFVCMYVCVRLNPCKLCDQLLEYPYKVPGKPPRI